MHISRGENEKNNTFTGLLTGARQRWGGKKKKNTLNDLILPAVGRQDCVVLWHLVTGGVRAVLCGWPAENTGAHQLPAQPFSQAAYCSFFSLAPIDVSVVSTTALLCLSFIGTPPFHDFFLLYSVFITSASFVSMLFLNYFSSFLYWLFFLTARAWAKACWSQSITFKDFRIKALFPLASLHLLQSFFAWSILSSVSLLKDRLLTEISGKERGLERKNPKDPVNSSLNC